MHDRQDNIPTEKPHIPAAADLHQSAKRGVAVIDIQMDPEYRAPDKHRVCRTGPNLQSNSLFFLFLPASRLAESQTHVRGC